MNAAILNLGGLRTADRIDTREPKAAAATAASSPSKAWDEVTFARQQIQGLVRRVFFRDAQPTVRQVVFSAIDAETDLRNMCSDVAHTLAREISGTVAVLGADTNVERYESDAARDRKFSMPLQHIATRVHGNLWLLPSADLGKGSISSQHSYLGELRREFDYSIVAGPPAAESDTAIALAEFADGIVLVLSANRTRRAAARKIIETLAAAQVRLLGTVLTDRLFPIPQPIYMRL